MMHVRIWMHDGRVSDRPMSIVWDYPDEPYRCRAAEWRADEYGGGTLIVVAAQVFTEDGCARSERMTFDPPIALQCDDRDVPERWTFRLPLEASA